MRWITLEVNSIIEELNALLKESSVDEGHGIDHALKVMNHCLKAVEEISDETIRQMDCDAIILAGLLHDADDAKFFKDIEANGSASNKTSRGECDCRNARYLLRDFSPNFVNLVVEMISLVSCSKNRNNIPEHVIGKEWMLIPRWADRLESTGQIGLDRAIIYTKVIERPFHTSDTKRATTLAELYSIATPHRFNSYKGVSESVIDHLYDKVLHLKVKTGIKYLDDIFEERHKVIEQFVLDYWRNQNAPHLPPSPTQSKL